MRRATDSGAARDTNEREHERAVAWHGPTAADLQRADLVVIGAGIVGLAVAFRWLQADPARSVTVVEAEDEPALHQTGRNSGVLHSGVYYAPGSLKARLTAAGRTSMAEFCAQRGIAHDICGKVIVATHADELARLRALSERAAANGIEAETIGPERLAELEPHCVGVEALHVGSTGIVDYRAVCAALRHEIESAGGRLVFGARVTGLATDRLGTRVETAVGDFAAARVVNCAGLHSDRVAALQEASQGNRIVPFRGEYYELAAQRRHLVRNLIYPVPDPSFPFLGVHLTRMIDGSVHAGPNAVLALAREGYRWRDVSRRQVREHLANRGLWRLARRCWRIGAAEVWRSLSKAAFVRALQRLVPDIAAADLVRVPAGVRAQAMSRDGELLDDFAVSRSGVSVHVLNAPSPAATSSLEIASHVVDLLDEAC